MGHVHYLDCFEFHKCIYKTTLTEIHILNTYNLCVKYVSINLFLKTPCKYQILAKIMSVYIQYIVVILRKFLVILDSMPI